MARRPPHLSGACDTCPLAAPSAVRAAFAAVVTGLLLTLTAVITPQPSALTSHVPSSNGRPTNDSNGGRSPEALATANEEEKGLAEGADASRRDDASLQQRMREEDGVDKQLNRYERRMRSSPAAAGPAIKDLRLGGADWLTLWLRQHLDRGARPAETTMVKALPPRCGGAQSRLPTFDESSCDRLRYVRQWQCQCSPLLNEWTEPPTVRTTPSSPHPRIDDKKRRNRFASPRSAEACAADDADQAWQRHEAKRLAATVRVKVATNGTVWPTPSPTSQRKQQRRGHRAAALGPSPHRVEADSVNLVLDAASTGTKSARAFIAMPSFAAAVTSALANSSNAASVTMYAASYGHPRCASAYVGRVALMAAASSAKGVSVVMPTADGAADHSRGSHTYRTCNEGAFAVNSADATSVDISTVAYWSRNEKYVCQRVPSSLFQYMPDEDEGCAWANKGNHGDSSSSIRQTDGVPHPADLVALHVLGCWDYYGYHLYLCLAATHAKLLRLGVGRQRRPRYDGGGSADDRCRNETDVAALDASRAVRHVIVGMPNHVSESAFAQQESDPLRMRWSRYSLLWEALYGGRLSSDEPKRSTPFWTPSALQSALRSWQSDASTIAAMARTKKSSAAPAACFDALLLGNPHPKSITPAEWQSFAHRVRQRAALRTTKNDESVALEGARNGGVDKRATDATRLSALNKNGNGKQRQSRSDSPTNNNASTIVVLIVNRLRNYRMLNANDVARVVQQRLEGFATALFSSRRAAAEHGDRRPFARRSIIVSRVVALETTAISEQINLFRAARLVVAVHGNGLTWIPMMQSRRSAVIEVWPSVSYNANYKRFADLSGVMYDRVEQMTQAQWRQGNPLARTKAIGHRPTRFDVHVNLWLLRDAVDNVAATVLLGHYGPDHKQSFFSSTTDVGAMSTLPSRAMTPINRAVDTLCPRGGRDDSTATGDDISAFQVLFESDARLNVNASSRSKQDAVVASACTAMLSAHRRQSTGNEAMSSVERELWDLVDSHVVAHSRMNVYDDDAANLASPVPNGAVAESSSGDIFQVESVADDSSEMRGNDGSWKALLRHALGATSCRHNNEALEPPSANAVDGVLDDMKEQLPVLKQELTRTAKSMKRSVISKFIADIRRISRVSQLLLRLYGGLVRAAVDAASGASNSSNVRSLTTFTEIAAITTPCGGPSIMTNVTSLCRNYCPSSAMRDGIAKLECLAACRLLPKLTLCLGADFPNRRSMEFTRELLTALEDRRAAVAAWRDSRTVAAQTLFFRESRAAAMQHRDALG